MLRLNRTTCLGRTVRTLSLRFDFGIDQDRNRCKIPYHVIPDTFLLRIRCNEARPFGLGTVQPRSSGMNHHPSVPPTSCACLPHTEYTRSVRHRADTILLSSFDKLTRAMLRLQSNTCLDCIGCMLHVLLHSDIDQARMRHKTIVHERTDAILLRTEYKSLCQSNFDIDQARNHGMCPGQRLHY